MDTSQSILKFAKRFFAGTLLSRFSGVLRDITMAFCFGSAPEIAGFMVAYRLSNLFRRLFGEGNLQAGFVPHFESLPKEEALYFYRDTSFSLLLLLLGAVGFMEGGLWLLGLFLGDSWEKIAHLAMWMAPGLIFICLYALNSSFLQCRKKYFSSAIAPVFFNMVWIAAALAAHRFPIDIAVRYLAIGIFAAFAFQWAATAIQVRREIEMPWSLWFRPHLFSSEWKRLIKPLTLGVIGVGAMQINSALDAIFSRLADPSGPAYLWYAIRVQQLPLALFGIALSGALLPPLSRAMKEEALSRYKSFLETALKQSAALMVPCTFAIFVLGGVGLNLLYGHGDFSSSDVKKTLYCLWGYGVGLLPAVFVLLLATGFYARKSYSMPTFASLFSLIFNCGLNAFMVFVLDLGALSIAIGTSLSSWINCAILALALKRRIGSLDFFSYFSRLVVCGAGAALLTFSLGFIFLGDSGFEGSSFTRVFGQQVVELGAMSLFFLFSFFGLAYLMKIGDWSQLLRGQDV